VYGLPPVLTAIGGVGALQGSVKTDVCRNAVGADGKPIGASDSAIESGNASPNARSCPSPLTYLPAYPPYPPPRPLLGGSAIGLPVSAAPA
jgi:hypothetical protein